MGFGQAIQSGFRNYVNFSGRASRSEYWFWTLFAVLVSIGLLIVDFLIAEQFVAAYGIGPLGLIVGLALFLPSLAVAVRRLHDRDQSGWWILIYLIPLVGPIIIIVWFCF